MGQLIFGIGIQSASQSEIITRASSLMKEMQSISATRTDLVCEDEA